MILSGLKIKDEVKKGNITISPFNDELLNPNSYNYRLGNELLVMEDEVINPRKKSKFKKVKIPKDGFVLQPNHLYLGSTVEVIGSDKYVTQLIGRSSVGRLGLFLQVTAPLGHVGCKHSWTLELKVVEPLKVYPNMKIGQVTFWKIDGKYVTYEGEYTNYQKPHISKFYKEEDIL